MKALRRLAVIVVAILALLFIVSWGLGKHWARDSDTLKITEGGSHFEARRDSRTGVWKIIASSPENLAFAFGYVQMHDREFQLELLRNLATGRLSSWFGASVLKRDRMGRFYARAARREWERLSDKSELRGVIASFLQGRKAYLRQTPGRLPVEFRLFGIRRDRIPEWEAWEILALSRFHSWEFSYDLNTEIRSHVVEKQLGPAWRDLLMPQEPRDSAEILYRQPGIRGVVPAAHRGSGVGPSMKWPGEFASLGEVPGAIANAIAATTSFPSSPLPGTFLRSELGASNLWIVSEGPQSSVLCNDTHLGFSWPGPLYPIEYRLPDVEAQGFMLPGAPALVIGRVDGKAQNFAWGITIANYADAQDLIRLEPKTLQGAHRFQEKFQVNDPKTGVASEEVFDEMWTDFGPRVDGIVDWKGSGAPGPVALDWIGFREAQTPVEFYMNRTLRGANGLREDLLQKWDFPSVNFTWMESDEAHGIRFGHRVTGYVFQRTNRDRPGPIGEKEARTRTLSSAKDRPGLEAKPESGKPFLMVSANQSIFSGDLASKLAWEWGDRSRVRRILELANELRAKPEKPQTDFRSLNLLDFVKSARARVAVDRLCAEGPDVFLRSCREVVAALDRWQGDMSDKDWVPTVAALWYVKAKESLWPNGFFAKHPQLLPLFSDWHKSTGGIRSLSNMMEESQAVRKWELLSGQTWNDHLAQAFADSLHLLVEHLGPMTQSWTWASVHHIDWMHPVKLIPGPVGPLLASSLLGPPISVPGGIDSPGRFDFVWNPAQPLDFPSKSGAAMRFCASMKEGNFSPTSWRWTGATGVSGNPLSKWAWSFAEDYYKNTLR